MLETNLFFAHHISNNKPLYCLDKSQSNLEFMPPEYQEIAQKVFEVKSQLRWDNQLVVLLSSK